MTEFSNPYTPKPKNYDGILGKKNREIDRMVEWQDAEKRADLQEWLLERERALFEHFSVEQNDDPDRWRKLAHALACAHIPAFKAKRGRPKSNRFVDHALARMFFLKHTKDQSEASTFRYIQEYIEQSQSGQTDERTQINLNVSERIKAYKKDHSEDYKNAENQILQELQEHDEQTVFSACLNAITMSDVFHIFVDYQNHRIDQWPNVNIEN
ncbi:hypothetical protein RB2083_2204 [Rhodobacteraceae bacterium HTCC2083]|nr:hypothetical protein RB2083_2204 [Rhodobacteraceae bacterium HTCC2083]